MDYNLKALIRNMTWPDFRERFGAYTVQGDDGLRKNVSIRSCEWMEGFPWDRVQNRLEPVCPLVSRRLNFN